MPDAFVPLAAFLQPPTEAEAAVPAVEAPPQPQDDAEALVAFDERDEALCDVRRFRAALAEALEVAVHALLREIACDVVARELRAQPADIAAIVAAARERLAGDEPLAVRAHPDESAALDPLGVRVTADPQLRRGDVVFELRSGTIDARLGTRLEAVLARCGA